MDNAQPPTQRWRPSERSRERILRSSCEGNAPKSIYTILQSPTSMWANNRPFPAPWLIAWYKKLEL